MKCAWMQDRLLLYLADELTPREIGKVIRHLETCARCTAVAEELAGSKEWARGVASTIVFPPSTLDARVMGSVRGQPARRRWWPALPPPWSWQRRLGMAAAGLCALIAVFYAGRWDGLRASTADPGAPSDRPTLDLALLGKAHRAYLTRPASIEVVSADPRRIERDLTPRVHFRVMAADLRREGARLCEGQYPTVQGAPVALLHYDWKGKRVSLFEMDGMRLAPPALRQMTMKGHCYLVGKIDDLSYVLWCTGTTNCVAVARIEPDQLFQLACRTCDKMESI